MALGNQVTTRTFALRFMLQSVFQGDQMIFFEKIAQNVAKSTFCQNLCITFTVEKDAQKLWDTSLIF
jgi:hypothetical protein